ncbi:hypothetical protein ES702_04933 [subsurface metagenome]
MKFKTMMEEAKYRLKIKKELKNKDVFYDMRDTTENLERLNV